jgi:hypothetical protein
MRLNDKNKNNKLLKEYVSLLVRKILNEDDYSDYDSYYDYGGGMGGGGGEVSSGTGFFKSDFARLFGLDTFKDAVSASGYALKSIATRLIGETKVTAKSLFYTLIPFIKPDDYGNILEMATDDRKEIENELKSVDQEYGELLERNQEIWKNPDFNFAFFLAAPGAVLGSQLAKKSLSFVTEAYDVLVPNDRQRKNYAEGMKNIFKEIMPSIGLNPNNPADFKLFQDSLATELRQNHPNLSDQDINSVLSSLYSGASLREQAEFAPPKNPIQQKISNMLSSRQGITWLNKVKQQVESFKNYMTSSKAQQNINSSPIAKKGQALLVKKLIEAATQSMNKFTIPYLQANYQKPIEEYFKKNGIEDPKKKQEILNDPQLSKELLQAFRESLKGPYIQQLDELQKMSGGNPEVNSLVKAGKEQLEKIVSGQS